jgi:uncharacterized membrane protein
MYSSNVDLDANGEFTITNPNWSEGVYEIYFDCEDGVGNVSSTFGAFGPVEIDLTISLPIVNPIATSSLSITGFADPLVNLEVSNAVCTNSPISADLNGNWVCELSVGLVEGLIVSIVATDLAGNVSEEATSTVLAVNVAPSFNVYCDIDATDVTSNISGIIQFPGFIYDMSTGPLSESEQAYNLFLAMAPSGDPDFIVDSMSLSSSGDLEVIINVGNSGVATLEVTMVDNGGTLVGGVDTTTVEFNVHNYADLNLDPRYMHLNLNDIFYKNSFDTCR